MTLAAYLRRWIYDGKPQVDFEEVVKASGMPVTESEVRDRFNAIAAEEGMITNTSRMSPFWRLITAIVTAPVMWLKEVLVSTVLANMFVATASGEHAAPVGTGGERDGETCQRCAGCDPFL